MICLYFSSVVVKANHVRTRKNPYIAKFCHGNILKVYPYTTGEGLFGPDHQIVDSNSITAHYSISKLGDL